MVQTKRERKKKKLKPSWDGWTRRWAFRSLRENAEVYSRARGAQASDIAQPPLLARQQENENQENTLVGICALACLELGVLL